MGANRKFNSISFYCWQYESHRIVESSVERSKFIFPINFSLHLTFVYRAARWLHFMGWFFFFGFGLSSIFHFFFNWMTWCVCNQQQENKKKICPKTQKNQMETKRFLYFTRNREIEKEISLNHFGNLAFFYSFSHTFRQSTKLSIKMTTT